MKGFRTSVFHLSLAAGFLLCLTQTATAELPDPGMKIDSRNTALLITDPQNDFLSPED